MYAMFNDLEATCRCDLLSIQDSVFMNWVFLNRVFAEVEASLIVSGAMHTQ